MVSIERQKDTAIIRVPAGLCLYEAKATPFVQMLTRFAEDLHRSSPPPVRGVLLLQTAPADDRVASWLGELEKDALFRDVVARLEACRWLFSLIRNAPVPWAYMSATDSYGSAWELALSCQRRYWFATGARLGFPDIAIGAFPPGGVLESLTKRTGRTREKWQGKPIFSAAEALEDGLVHFCSDAASWETAATSLFTELLAANPKAGVRDATRKRRKEEYFDITASPESRRAAYEQLETVWKTEALRSHKYPSAWDYCWQLVKERTKLKEPGDLGRLIAHIATRHFFERSYQAWIATHLVARTDVVPARPGASAAFLPPVTIDLNYLAPPTEVLVRLLRHDVQVVFAAAEAKALSVALNLIFNRLERQIGAAPAMALWERHVTWYQGVCDEVRGLVLRWAVDDRFLVSQSGIDTSFLRLEGNGSTAKPGLLEWDGAPLAPLVRQIAALVSDGFLHTGLAAPGLPMSVYVRSLFLEEMLRISGHAGGEVTNVTEALRATGWHFAGDDEAWDRFLRTRHDAYSFESDLTGLGAKPIDRANWEVGTWKHARVLAKRQPVDPTAVKWNATAVSLHLAVFLGLVAELITRTRGLAERRTADHLCAVALGFPEGYGTPLTFLRRRGRRRVELYARAQWPRFQFAETWSSDGPSG